MSAPDELSPEKQTFALFNIEALKPNSSSLVVQDGQPASLLADTLSDKDFLKKMASPIEANAQLYARKRSRKGKQKKAKNVNDKDITLKEILEDHQSGIPTQAEVKMREEKLKKLQQGRKNKFLAIEANSNPEPVREPVNLFANLSQNTKQSDTIPKLEADSNPLGPKIVLKDGKPMIEHQTIPITHTKLPKNLTVVNKKAEKLNSMSFKSRSHTAKWTEEETKKFYKALSMFGPDFSMIASMFKDRTRSQLKNKFHREEKLNASKIDSTFHQHKRIDVRSFLNDTQRAREGRLGVNQHDNAAKEEKLANEVKSNKRPVRETSATSSLDSMDRTMIEEIKEILAKESMQMQQQHRAQQRKSSTTTEKSEPVKSLLLQSDLADNL